MKFAETGYLREVCLDLPVSILWVLHAKRLECEKLMASMASVHHSRLCWSRWDSSAVAALLDFPVGGIQERVIKTLELLITIWYVIVSVTAWDQSFGHFDYGTADVLISLLSIVKLCVASLVRRL